VGQMVGQTTIRTAALLPQIAFLTQLSQVKNSSRLLRLFFVS